MLEYPFQLNELKINETVEIEDIEYFIGTETRTGCWLIIEKTLYLGKVHQFIIENNNLDVSKDDCIFGYYYNDNAVIDSSSYFEEDYVIPLLKEKFKKIFVLNMSDNITRLASYDKIYNDCKQMFDQIYCSHLIIPNNPSFNEEKAKSYSAKYVCDTLLSKYKNDNKLYNYIYNKLIKGDKK